MKTEDIELARVARAKFTELVTLRDAWGDDHTFTPQQVAKAQERFSSEDLKDALDDASEYATAAEIAKVVAKQKPVLVIDGEPFPSNALAKAVVTVRALRFKIDGRRSAMLTPDGKLEIGCQTHSLDEWAGVSGDAVIENHHFVYEKQLALKAKRDALIPILRSKLAAELKAHPPTRKRAKKAA